MLNQIEEFPWFEDDAQKLRSAINVPKPVAAEVDAKLRAVNELRNKYGLSLEDAIDIYARQNRKPVRQEDSASEWPTERKRRISLE